MRREKSAPPQQIMATIFIFYETRIRFSTSENKNKIIHETSHNSVPEKILQESFRAFHEIAWEQTFIHDYDYDKPPMFISLTRKGA